MAEFRELGAAVIGTGFIGTVHVQALRRLGVDVRGVLGSSAARGQARAAEIGRTGPTPLILTEAAIGHRVLP